MTLTRPSSHPIDPPILYVGTPVAIISTSNPDGSPNLTAMSSVWALDDRLVLGLGRSGQGLENLRRTGEAVVNFPSSELWQRVEALAPTTGKTEMPEWKRSLGYFHEPRKFERGGFTPLASEQVGPPRIAECPLQMEAKLLVAHPSTARAGESAFEIVEVQVLRVHAHEGLAPDGRHVDVHRWSPLLYVFRNYFGTGPRLGQTFRATAPAQPSPSSAPELPPAP